MLKLIQCTLILLVGSYTAHGQALVYHPINSAFGGNSYNSSWMLSSAQAQDKLKDPASAVGKTTTYQSQSTLNNFSQSLQQQLLGRISQNLVKNQFGEGNTLKEGSYRLGDFTLDVNNQADGIYIRIVDNKGGETTVVIPYF